MDSIKLRCFDSYTKDSDAEDSSNVQALGEFGEIALVPVVQSLQYFAPQVTHR